MSDREARRRLQKEAIATHGRAVVTHDNAVAFHESRGDETRADGQRLASKQAWEFKGRAEARYDRLGEDGASEPLTHEQLLAENERLKTQVENLKAGLESNRRIGAAIGIIMATQLVTQEGAFDLLRAASQQRHRKLREVAEEVLYLGMLPETSGHQGPSADGHGQARPAADRGAPH